MMKQTNYKPRTYAFLKANIQAQAWLDLLVVKLDQSKLYWCMESCVSDEMILLDPQFKER